MRHSEAAIKAYEQAKEKVDVAHPMMASGDLGGENIGKLYWFCNFHLLIFPGQDN